MAKTTPSTEKSPQQVQNEAQDTDMGAGGVVPLGIVPMESDGEKPKRAQSSLVASKTVIVTSGSNKTIYSGITPIGTAETALKWQANKTVISVSGGTKTITTTWAGGGEFNQRVDDITNLTFV